MNIKLNARLRAYTKARDFNDIFSFIKSLPEEDGNYLLTLTVVDGERKFDWVKQIILKDN